MRKEKKGKDPAERKLKIYSKYFERSYRGVTLPEIRLCGRWLQNVGFNCGQAIIVKHKKNKLTITVIDPLNQK